MYLFRIQENLLSRHLLIRMKGNTASLELSQEANLQLPVRILLPEPLMGACLKLQDARLELSCLTLRKAHFRGFGSIRGSLRRLIYLAAI